MILSECGCVCVEWVSVGVWVCGCVEWVIVGECRCVGVPFEKFWFRRESTGMTNGVPVQ